MRLGIIHLSDLHQTTANSGSERQARSVVAAVKDRDPELDGLLIVISGDLAYSGRSEEYGEVEGFVQSLIEHAQSSLLAEPVRCVVVPGNHDCKVEGSETAARDAVLKVLDPATLDSVEDTQERTLTDVQEPFFKFSERLGLGLTANERLYRKLPIQIKDSLVEVHLLNTAWMSTLPERPASLAFPVALLPNGSDADLSVVVQHHPLTWLHPVCARKLEAVLGSMSDLILTGHEHAVDVLERNRASGARTIFLEAPAFAGEPDLGEGFSFYIVSLERDRRWRTIPFKRAAERWTPIDERTSWSPLPLRGSGARSMVARVEHLTAIDDLGMQYLHPAVETLRRSDVFVYPDIRKVDLRTAALGTIMSSADLAGLRAKIVLITGSEQAGKTTLAKQVWQDTYDSGLAPVLLDGTNLRFSSGDVFLPRIARRAGDQYRLADEEAYLQLEAQDRVLVIDNFHKLSMTPDRVERFVSTVTHFAGKTFLLANSFAQAAAELSDARRVLADRPDCEQYRIERLGFVRRDELVERWIVLDPAVGRDPSRVGREVADAGRTLDIIIGKNFVPAYPFVILSVLQGRTFGDVDLRASTYGYFYEILVKAALAKGATSIEYDVKTQFLTELAFELHKSGSLRLDGDALDGVVERFKRERDIRFHTRDLIEGLLDGGIISRVGESVGFKHPYAGFYFTAQYINDNLARSNVRDEVRDLANRLDEERPANVLLFLAHLTKDPFILECLLASAGMRFGDVPEATIERDSTGEEISPEIGPGEVAIADSSEARRTWLAERDRVEPDEPNLVSDLPAEASAYLREIGAAFKTVQILGQIIKNFPGSLWREDKEAILRGSFGLGMRALGSLLGHVEQSREEMVEYFIAEEERYGGGSYLPAELREHARRTLASLVRFAAFGSVKRIADSLGAPHILETFDRVAPKNNAGKLTSVAMRLDQGAAFPVKRILELHQATEKNPLANGVLRFLAVTHFHQFPVGLSDKQKVCAALNIPIKGISAPDPRKRLVPGTKPVDR